MKRLTASKVLSDGVCLVPCFLENKQIIDSNKTSVRFLMTITFQILTLSGPAFSVVRRAGSEARMPKIKVNIN